MTMHKILFELCEYLDEIEPQTQEEDERLTRFIGAITAALETLDYHDELEGIFRERFGDKVVNEVANEWFVRKTDEIRAVMGIDETMLI